MKPITINDNNNKRMVALSKRELNLIVESLLFASSVSIGAEWKEEDYNDMVKIASSIENNLTDTDIKNLTFFIEENYEDNWSVQILNTFKDKIKKLELSKS
jgi:outer membrane receptor for ferrienterochelin and colicin